MNFMQEHLLLKHGTKNKNIQRIHWSEQRRPTPQKGAGAFCTPLFAVAKRRGPPYKQAVAPLPYGNACRMLPHLEAVKRAVERRQASNRLFKRAECSRTWKRLVKAVERRYASNRLFKRAECSHTWKRLEKAVERLSYNLLKARGECSRTQKRLRSRRLPHNRMYLYMYNLQVQCVHVHMNIRANVHGNIV